MRYFLEETEASGNGLDIMISNEDGRYIAWAYTLDDGEKIVKALNREVEEPK